MNQKVTAIILCSLVCLSITSCMSVKSQRNSVNEGTATLYEVQSCSVNTTIDSITDDLVSAQVLNMISSQLCIDNQVDDESSPLTLSVTLTQRQFFKDLDCLNSIYLFFTLIDENGRTVLSEGYFVDTKDSLVSSVQQNKLAAQVASSCASYLMQCRKTRTE